MYLYLHGDDPVSVFQADASYPPVYSLKAEWRHVTLVARFQEDATSSLGYKGGKLTPHPPPTTKSRTSQSLTCFSSPPPPQVHQCWTGPWPPWWAAWWCPLHSPRPAGLPPPRADEPGSPDHTMQHSWLQWSTVPPLSRQHRWKALHSWCQEDLMAQRGVARTWSTWESCCFVTAVCTTKNTAVRALALLYEKDWVSPGLVLHHLHYTGYFCLPLARNLFHIQHSCNLRSLLAYTTQRKERPEG